MIIKDQELTIVAKSVRPDAKKRVVLPKSLVKEGIIFHIYSNNAGQIVLDPQVTIPASEAWLFKNKAALAAVDKGIVESTNGKTIDRGSFAKYTKDAP
jgi:hypothetical protein